MRQFNNRQDIIKIFSLRIISFLSTSHIFSVQFYKKLIISSGLRSGIHKATGIHSRLNSREINKCRPNSVESFTPGLPFTPRKISAPPVFQVRL